MNRRGFFKALGFGAAAAAGGSLALLDQELWTPSRTFFLPPAGGWSSRGCLNVGDLITIQGHEGHEGLWVIGERSTELWTYAKPALNQMISAWQA